MCDRSSVTIVDRTWDFLFGKLSTQVLQSSGTSSKEILVASFSILCLVFHTLWGIEPLAPERQTRHKVARGQEQRLLMFGARHKLAGQEH